MLICAGSASITLASLEYKVLVIDLADACRDTFGLGRFLVELRAVALPGGTASGAIVETPDILRV